jgi:hypothetical protein
VDFAFVPCRRVREVTTDERAKFFIGAAAAGHDKLAVRTHGMLHTAERVGSKRICLNRPIRLEKIDTLAPGRRLSGGEDNVVELLRGERLERD